ncbi:carbohydrate ABC transporter permease [Parasedimentitalea psychrophila]|uniref:Sugar ABC transporter permease n=1 Tax=Parasedimentitalea psychrophila TaxID=2997337 RepID=A0A9Y2KY41_9RHOB|nr:sugar ABC transporter permease [Parasedimentitalea psychrophila]WIY24579.1 sugar ABC transporter permease [Parasedimentitalea psychrophila]
MSPKIENRILATPIVLFLLVMLGFPAVLDILYSFSEVSFENLRAPTLNGGKNFVKVVNDPEFWAASWFSLKFGVATALSECILGLVLAVYLAPIIRKNNWMIAVLIMPMIIAPAMMGLMYRLVLHEFVGSLPHYLYLWLGDSPAFLSRENVFLTVFTIETLQWTPFAFLLFYMAYEAIPSEMREAAAVDGTRPWRMFWFIEVPQMAPTLAVAFFIRFIDGFRVFDNIFVLTGAGAGGSTTSLSIYIYLSFFRSGDIGKALAASVILFCVAFVILFFAGRVLRRDRA